MSVELPAIEIGDESTWPEPVRALTAANKPLAVAYQRERARIERLCEDDILARINPPINQHENAYTAVASELEGLLSECRLIAYHCTRLTPREIADIKRNGLRTLSVELARTKIENCASDGHLTKTQADYMLRSEQLSQTITDKAGKRTGQIAFCPNRSTLREPHSVHRLLRSWGGEAVYWGHEDDDSILSLPLRRIGTPCIIKCAVPYADIKAAYRRLAERFLSQIVSTHMKYPEPSPKFDLFADHELLPSNVLDIIEFGDPRFQELTAYASWNADYRIESDTVKA